MIRWLLHKRITAFERRWAHDCVYLHRIAQISPLTAAKVTLLRSQPPPGALPFGAYAAARITATLAAECGSCLSLAIDMCEADGFPRSSVEAIMAGKEPVMAPDVRLGYRFANAIVQRNAEASARLGADIRGRWGDKAHLAMSMAVASAGLYPSLKRAFAVPGPAEVRRLAA